MQPVDSYVGTFAQWHSRELVLLRNIARKVSAWMQDPTDPAVSSCLPELRVLSTELFEHRRAGRARGWQ